MCTKVNMEENENKTNVLLWKGKYFEGDEKRTDNRSRLIRKFLVFFI